MLLLPPPSSSSSTTTTTTTTTPLFSLNPPKYPSKPRLIPIKSLQSPQYDVVNNNNNSSSSSNNNNLEDFLLRRPLMQTHKEEKEEEEEEKSVLDRKLPIFDTPSSVIKGPPMFDRDRTLYKAKILTEEFEFRVAEVLLQQCIYNWPEDGRPYVALGKVFRRQNRTAEARAVYEKGSQATQGENAFIWQCWAVLEGEAGNVSKARELFDAATVANKKHIAAWHGWAVLEVKQGNIQKARYLLGKAIEYCGGDEYVYQTLALLEAKDNRYDKARNLFRLATKCCPTSCASWLAWAQLEVQQKNNRAATCLFEKAVQANPKERVAWYIWGLFEANCGRIDEARKLLKIGHLVNPRNPVLLQALALLEYKHSTANASRVLFRRASELDPRNQSVLARWGCMEWQEGNLATARELYQKVLSIDATTERAAWCLETWIVLERRVGNMSAARRLFRLSLNINSQRAKKEEDQGNSVRAEEIHDLYFQQRTEVVDDASWVMGFMDILGPSRNSLEELLNFEQDPFQKARNSCQNMEETKDDEVSTLVEDATSGSGFDLNAFVKKNLSLDISNLDDQMETSLMSIARFATKDQRKISRSGQRFQ